MDKMMNEKNLRELEYEREMQEQADDIERWKLRKEIKKKLRTLRKKIKADEASLPQLQTISRRFDDVEKPLEPCVRANDELIPNLNSCEKNLEIMWQPCHTEHYHRKFVYNPRMIEAPFEKDVILEEMAEEFGYELLKAGAIQYRIYDGDSRDTKIIEMKVDVVVEDRC